MIYWKRVILSDGTKINYFKHGENAWVWSFSKEEHEENVTIKTVKHSEESMMPVEHKSANGPGNPIEIKEIIDKITYLSILQENLNTTAEKSGLGSYYVF
ncbi:hypothetical protein CDIK_1793 [Cucumispora dikerogammari]|nr:hypothetical protein CDIK_1793 [Cucumispora dikerogammari]